LRRGAAEQSGLLVGGVAGRDPLKGVPQHLIAAGALVDREIALEHRALGAESGYAGLDVGAPSLLQVLGGRRLIVVEEGVAGELHPEPAELHVGVGEAGNGVDAVAPLGKPLLALAGIRSDRQWRAAMIEHDRRLREGAGQIDNVAELRLEHPGVKGETQRGEGCKPFAKALIEQQPRRTTCGERLERWVLAPGRAVADAAQAAVGDCYVPLEY